MSIVQDLPDCLSNIGNLILEGERFIEKSRKEKHFDETYKKFSKIKIESILEQKFSEFVDKISKWTKELENICFVDKSKWMDWNTNDFIKYGKFDFNCPKTFLNV